MPAPGDVLGGRFEVRGVLGRGGMATVYLAHDRVRDQRIALKVLHPHLLGDPSSRRRLRREVQAAALVRHEAALVAFELHEFDGAAALSLPFYPGETLAEAVTAGRKLSQSELRSVGLRVAEVLALSHRVGVLHRDVTPNNVMIDASGHSVLTDFGLAQVAGSASTKGTAALGTVGYAAPEVYAGERSDPRSDLYSLGAVLYFGATGKQPFGSDTAMGALQQQLSGEYRPLEQLRPDLEPDFVATVDSLLQGDANLRPQGAADVVAALTRKRAPERSTGPLPWLQAEPNAVQRALPEGQWAVIVKDGKHRARRDVLRVDRGRVGATPESFVHRSLLGLWDGMKEILGVRDVGTPEERLVAAVARVASLPPAALELPDALIERKFRLIDGIDQSTAAELVVEARRQGFHAEAKRGPVAGSGWGVARFGVVRAPLIASIWLGFTTLVAFGVEPLFLLAPAIVMTIVFATMGGRRQPAWRALPLAFGEDLTEHAAVGYEHVLASDEPELSRGEELLQRAQLRLDALSAAVNESTHLPEPAVRDLRSLIQQLSAQAQALAADVDRLDGEAATHDPSSSAESAWLASRRERLQTLRDAGDVVDADELARLDEALAAQAAAEEAQGRVTSRLTAAVAQLLEIAASAARTRLDLLAHSDAEAVPELVQALGRDAQAMRDARRELDARVLA
ncbi:MAG: serine/threonine protein kinase [Proteobacteria bacterium]|nr:serine/threonine protein kinase [Pseudomonadota bacterium]